MAVMAFWGQEQWEVSPAQVKALEGLSTSYTLKADANNDTSGTPPVNTTGKELQPVSFSWCVYDIAGVNVRNEISRWGSRVGEKNPLYIGAARFGPPLMQLQKVDVSDVAVDSLGRFRQAKLSISLVEFVPSVKKAYSSGVRSGAGGAVSGGSGGNFGAGAATSAGGGHRVGANDGGPGTASQVTASALDKELRKMTSISSVKAGSALNRILNRK